MTKLRRARSGALAVLLALLLCPVPPVWAQAWKDAYLKGIEHMGAGRWAEAAQAFEGAIRGNPREEVGVRLYGMRYGYFPHRDKGIALYRAERWEEAVQALRESVRQGVAPEAASYLERAQQRQPLVEVPHVFRGTWWDHYERGLLYAERGLWKPAIEDFRTARRVRDQEDRGARTYGVHFIDYFPSRELGVALYHDGQYKAAAEALERSLARRPTSKAGYYYNLTRGALLKQSATDRTPPRIVIEAPSGGLLTNGLALEVRGTVESRNLVGTLIVNGEPEVIEVAQPTLPFATVVSLVPGPNTIEVVARDLVANESRATVDVVVDREGPVVVLDSIARTARGAIRLDGTVYDNVRLGSLQINGQPVPLSGTTESAFTWEARAPGDTILIEAVDAAGNPTRMRLPIPAEARQPGARHRRAIVPVAWSDRVVQIFPTREPLTIEVEPLPAEVQQETIPISFEVTAASGLTAVKINGEAKTLRQTDAGKRQLFSHILALVEGENVFEIEATDRVGHTKTKKVRTIRKAAELETIGSRLSVAVMPFQRKGKPSELYEGAYDALVDTLVNQRRFRIVGRIQLEDILKELKLSKSELVDQATAIRVGKLVAAEAIMVGTINETATGAEVYVQLINAETSTILTAKDVFDPAKAAGSARERMRELATKVRQDYPLVGGPVVSVVNRRVAVALGTRKQVRADMRVIVYLEGDPLIDPQTKLVLDRSIEPLGEGLLNEVRPALSFAILKAEDLRKVEQLVSQKKNLKVITK